MLGFNLFGLFFIYQGKIQLCKIRANDYSDADHKIPESTLTVFSSNTSGIKFLNEKEILFDGKLYDIIRSETDNGKTLYYTLSDKEEDEYQLDLTDWEKNHSQETSIPGKSINLHLEKYFTTKRNHIPVFDPSLFIKGKAIAISDAFLYKPPSKNIFAPPPDNLIS